MVKGFFWVDFCIVTIKKNLHANETKVFFRFFLQILQYFQGKLFKVAVFRYYIHKSYQYKSGF